MWPFKNVFKISLNQLGIICLLIFTTPIILSLANVASNDSFLFALTTNEARIDLDQE